MSESSGLLNLAFPAAVSNAILRRMGGERARASRHSAETRQRMRELIGRCRTEAALDLPRVRVPASALTGLQAGSLVRLNLPARTPAQLRAGGVVWLDAVPVNRSERRAAQLVAPGEVRA